MAQPVFTNASAMLSHNASSGGCMAVTDMDDDGLDDIVQLDMSTHVYVLYQNPDHSFVSFDYGEIDSSNQWGWAIGDVDNNGHKDIFSGAGSANFYLRISSRGVSTLSALDGPGIFTQCMSLGDINNDGRVDVFACHDNGHPNIWFTNASGVPINTNNYINWATACTGSSGDMSGNYGSTFTDFDNDGDLDLHISHCRQGVDDPNDCRRWDRLFVNDGTNHYTDQAAAYGLENHEQVWTTDFGDYDNDGDLDAVSTTHSSTIMLFENDGTGHMTNVTAGCGMEVPGFFLQGLFRDFDNDGFLDVLTASTHFYFKGNGNGTFTQMNNVFPAGKTMHSFAIGDLNGDGFEDVYASYGDGYVDGDPSFPDRLWLNTPNGNHWLNVKLKGVQSNHDAIGAKVTITGPWGTQEREVHAGESYGIVNSTTCHFGLGANMVVNSVVIHWPSGQVDTYNDLNADQNITVVEGTCISPNVNIALSGPAVICTGGAGVTLDATMAGSFTYMWNDNSTSPTLNVTTGGTYTVTLDDGTGCTGEASVFIAQDPDQTPTVTVDGETIICQGSQVTLTSSATTGNQWSSGAGTSQSISVNTAGTYTVTIIGACATFTSAPVVVDVLAAPVAPVSSDANIPYNTTANLTATGTNVVWYDAGTGGNLVGNGNNWTTPALIANTSYWCADQNIYGGVITYGAQTDKSTSGQYSNSGNYLIFDATEDFVLKSAKVYANGAGDRSIAVVDLSTNNTIASGTFTVPTGESRVQLNFNIPIGGPYGLEITSNNPQLWRDGLGSTLAYPYALSTLGTITSSSVTGGNALNYYYFFYDWEVQSAMTVCDGPRTQVDVTVGPQSINENDATGLNAFPVPTRDALTITFGSITGAVEVDLVDITGRMVIGQHASNSATMIMNVASLAAGQYELRVRHANGTVLRRVDIR